MVRREWAVVAVATAVAGGFAAMCVIQAWRVYHRETEYKQKHNIPAGAWACTELHGRLYEAYDRVAQALYDSEIQHWGICGTALGALRHGGIIPWDDDVDIGVWEADMEEAKKALEAAGHQLRPTWWGVKVDDSVDIFPFGPDGRYTSKQARMMWSRERFDPESLRNFSRVTFGPTQLTVNADVEGYLDRAFGKTWSTHCVVKAPHEIGPLWAIIWWANPLITKAFSLPAQADSEKRIEEET